MIKVKNLLKNNYLAWDSFVRSANNGTIFHLREFLNYHPENRFKDNSLEFYKDNKLLSVFPAADVSKDGKRILVSHPGSSYGSFVTKDDLSIKDAIAMVEELNIFAKKESFDGIQMTMPPSFYSNRISNYIEYALLSSGFDYSNREITSTLTLEKNKESILKKFKPSHQRAVKKSRKRGVEIKITNEVDEFFSILETNLKIRHDVKPTHTIDELKTLISKKQTAPLTVGRIEELRATFSRAYTDAVNSNNFSLANRIIASKNQIFTNLYDNIGRASDDEFRLMAENSKAANNWFATEYAPRFEEGVASMWAEAFKKRKSGSLNSSSPEQSPLFFLKNDGKGLYINNSSEAGINQLENILNPPKGTDGKPLVQEFVDANSLSGGSVVFQSHDDDELPF